jgi:hypothetical protein
MKKASGIVGGLALVVWGCAACAGEPARLPLLSEWAGERELPLPFGLTVLCYGQDHGYDINRLSASSALDPRIGPMVQQLDPATIDVDNEVTQIGLKADVWLFPFLNVFALAGRIDGETEVSFGALPPEAAPVLGALDRGLDVEYSGFVYGIGCTLTWGAGPAFAAVNGVATWTDLDEETSVEAYVVRPLVGVRVGALALWAGAMYQRAQEEHEGAIALPGLGSIAYDLELEEQEPWNALVGASYAITANWQIGAEAGFGERTQLEMSVAYRF